MLSESVLENNTRFKIFVTNLPRNSWLDFDEVGCSMFMQTTSILE